MYIFLFSLSSNCGLLPHCAHLQNNVHEFLLPEVFLTPCVLFFLFYFFSSSLTLLWLSSHSWLAQLLVREVKGSSRFGMNLELPSRSMNLWKVLRTESLPLLAHRIRSRTPSTFYRTGRFSCSPSLSHLFFSSFNSWLGILA